MTYLNVPSELRVTVPCSTLSKTDADKVSPSISISLLNIPRVSISTIKLSPDSNTYSSSRATGASFTGETIITTSMLSVTLDSSLATYVNPSFPKKSATGM